MFIFSYFFNGCYCKSVKVLTKKMETILRKRYYVKTFPILPNGNCLFASIVHQITKLDCDEYLHQAAVQAMRKACVMRLRSNKRRYWNNIIMETIERGGQWPEEGEEAQEQMIDNYIDNLENDGVWAGSEALLAISDILNLKIRLFSEGCDPLEFGAGGQGEGDEQKQVIYVFYNGRDHYDSIDTLVDLETNQVWVLDTPEEVESSTDRERFDAEIERDMPEGTGGDEPIEEECSEHNCADEGGVCVQESVGGASTSNPKSQMGFVEDVSDARIGECDVPRSGRFDAADAQSPKQGGLQVEEVIRVNCEELMSSVQTGECDVPRTDDPDAIDAQSPKQGNLQAEEEIQLDYERSVHDGVGDTGIAQEQMFEEFLPTARQVTSVLGPVLKYVVSPKAEDSLLFACAILLEECVSDSARIKHRLKVLQDAASKYVDYNRELISRRIQEWDADSVRDWIGETNTYTLFGIVNQLKIECHLYDQWGGMRCMLRPDATNGHLKKIRLCVVKAAENAVLINGIIKFYKEYIKLPLPTTIVLPPQKEIDSGSLAKICSWNVRGCCERNKREVVNDQLLKANVHFACLQEVNVEAEKLETADFNWFISKNKNNKSRGLAFLVRKLLDVSIVKLENPADNIQLIVAIIPTNKGPTEISFVNIHAPNNGYSKFLGDLGACISRRENVNKVIVLGDTNAQLGGDDLEDDERAYVGKFIGHKVCNSNGLQLKFFIKRHDLVLRSTMADKSLTTTWASGSRSSQIDHIMTTTRSKIFLKKIKASWNNAVCTDHKMVVAWLRIQDVEKPSHTMENCNIGRRQDWNIQLLQDVRFRESYQKQLQLEKVNVGMGSTSDAWNSFVAKIKKAAMNSISKLHSVPLSPERRKSYAAVKRYSKRVKLNPYDQQALQNLKTSQCRFSKLCAQKEQEKQKLFFEEIKNVPLVEKRTMTHKYMKKFKKKVGRTTASCISMKKWLFGDSGPVLLPPKLDFAGSAFQLQSGSIDRLLKELKNGKAPGMDGINAELIKYADSGTIQEFKDILVRVWEENEVPEGWRQTLMVPIPKVARPKSVDDYRRISLSSIGYKVYASWLLEALLEQAEIIGTHQAAFLQGRSTLHHIFVAKRVLEENWNAGDEVIVMGLDISKAFDNISLENLVEVLDRKNVPRELTARIVACVRDESFQTLWEGQISLRELRRRGIKQGCPLSPVLFDLILEFVLRKVEQDMKGKFVLDQHKRISFPMVLVYADDVLILAKDTTTLDLLLTSMRNRLDEVNLKVNPDKSKVVIRSPYGEVPTHIKLDGTTYSVSTELTYLGITITDRLCRAKTLRSRCQKAVKASKIAIEFAKENRPTPEIGKMLYETIVAPTMYYGSQMSVLTKRSRMSLRRYERQIVNELAKFCVDPEKEGKEVDPKKLLDGKTITKRIRALQMRFWAHLERMTDSHLLQLVAKYKKNYRKRGRPAFTWLDMIADNMERYEDMDLEDFEELAQDKHKMNTKIDEILEMEESAESGDELWF